jgi:hypothetical protein
MAVDRSAEQAAKDYVDGALAARRRLGYPAKISKKSYGRAVNQVAGVFERLHEANGPPTKTASNGRPAKR